MSVRWKAVSVDMRRSTILLHGRDLNTMQDRYMWIRLDDVAQLREQLDRAEQVLRRRVASE